MKSNLRILVVDDFPILRRIVRNLLVESGYSNALIEEADDGDSALAMLHAKPFDLVITDCNMPRMSGMDLLRAMRSESSMAELPVLMVTAERSGDQMAAATLAGANGYIVKPFGIGTLQEKLERICGHSGVGVAHA